MYSPSHTNLTDATGIKNAVTKSAIAIANWIFFSGRPDTKPAPSQAPIVAAASIPISVIGSTSITVININVFATTGHVQETFNVPGSTLSCICLNPLSKAVLGAKLPIPSVSKKLVINPIIPAVAKLVSVSKLSLCFETSLINSKLNYAVSAPSTPNIPVIIVDSLIKIKFDC